MILAQCSLRDSGDDVTREGDVIVLALPGHPWGTQDAVRFLIVEWEDEDAEQVLLNRRAAGEPWPVISLPYAEKKEKERGRLKRRSFLRVDIEALPHKCEVRDRTRHTRTLGCKEYHVKSDKWILIEAIKDAVQFFSPPKVVVFPRPTIVVVPAPVSEPTVVTTVIKPIVVPVEPPMKQRGIVARIKTAMSRLWRKVVG